MSWLFQRVDNNANAFNAKVKLYSIKRIWTFLFLNIMCWTLSVYIITIRDGSNKI